jgi:UDP-N-acetylglucosamine 2-epimerase (non-hydrolysing)
MMAVASRRPRVLVVIGTRPEGIKLAPVIAALGAQTDQVEVRIVLTGQHTDLLDQVLDVFALRPDWDLGVMREGQDLYDVTHACLDELRDVHRAYTPDLTLVQGDTATVFLAGLVTYYERGRLGHVEAGLRSGDKWRPYPEEIYRRLTGVMADLHFAPTPAACENLLRENVPAAQVFVTGNTVVDALLEVAARPYTPANAALQAAVAAGRRLVLLTAHRRESFGAPLREVFGAVRALVDGHPDVVVVHPVHPNPNVRAAAEAELAGHERVLRTAPLDYLDLVWVLRRSALVLTDSGGIQEEAPTFGVPVLVLRDVTERPEGVAAGTAQLVGTDATRILEAAAAALSRVGTASAGVNPYGDGRAGARIADIVVHALTGAPRRTEDWVGAAGDRSGPVRGRAPGVALGQAPASEGTGRPV